MKVGLYFGSFNPVHIGHCIIASHVANNTDIEQVWLIVSPLNPLKPAASLLNEYHRLFLAKKAIEEDPALKVSDIEFHLPRPSYTIDTLAYLSENHPQHEFAIIMGSDSFQNISKWKNAKQLLSNYDIYVYHRPGYTIDNKEGQARLKIIDAPLLEISSTVIRSYVHDKKSIRFLVPEAVREEIERNGYYK